MFKRVVLLTCVFLLVLPVAANDDMSIYVNDEALEVPEGVIVTDGTTKVPLRTITEAFGARIDWNGEKKIVTIFYDDTILELFINKNIVKINGNEKILEYPPQINNNLTYVPLRFISEEFNAKVNYIQKLRSIYIDLEKNWQSAKSIAFDKINKKIYTYTQGNNFETEKAIPRKLTVLDEISGEILEIYDDLLSEENTLILYNNYLYQYRFIPKIQRFGITKQSLDNLMNIEVLNHFMSREQNDIRLIGVVNNTLYINNQGNIKSLNLASNQQTLIYAGQAEDVHLSQEEIILFDEDKIISLSLDGTNQVEIVSEINKDYSSSLDNFQMRVVDSHIYYISNNEISRVDIKGDSKEVLISNLDENINVKTIESIEDKRFAELITNFLPNKNDLYISKVKESFVLEEDEKKSLTKDQLKTYRSYSQTLYKKGMLKDIIFNQKEEDYKFGTHGSVFPLMKYLYKQGDYIYLLNRYLGESTYYRFNVKTKTLAPLAYNIKKFEYNN